MSLTRVRSAAYAVGLRLTDPTLFVPAFLVFTMTGLWVDSFTTLPQQVLLSVVPWVVLLVVALPLTTHDRIRVAVVVVAATMGEIVGSIIWGLYVYRLENLPLFVPAGHGLVYLAGLQISRLPALHRRRGSLIGVAIGLVAAWGTIGLTGWLGRVDAAGAFGCLVVIVFLLTSRNAPVIAGVFLVVAVLEIYGVWIGTWSWVPVVPGLTVGGAEITMGNPPSGAIAGYVGFDLTGVLLGPYLARWLGHADEPTAPGATTPRRTSAPRS
ncbi:MAG: hypothetical protein ACRCYQ_03530 [Nocardioides sp.]